METGGDGCDGPGGDDAAPGHGFGAVLAGLIVAGAIGNAWRGMWVRPPWISYQPERSQPPSASLDPRWALECRSCGARILPEYHSCPRCGGRLVPALCPYCGQVILRGAERCAACGSPQP